MPVAQVPERVEVRSAFRALTHMIPYDALLIGVEFIIHKRG